MINSFKEVVELYNNHQVQSKVSSELNSKTSNELLRIKDKSREIIKEMLEGGVTDRDDKTFLLENIITFSKSSVLLENNFSVLLPEQEKRLIGLIPSGFNLSALLHPDFPYTLSFLGSGFDTIIKNHEAIMKEKSSELERLKSSSNFIEIKSELERLNKILNVTSIENKNKKNDLELINRSLDLLRSCPF